MVTGTIRLGATSGMAPAQSTDPEGARLSRLVEKPLKNSAFLAARASPLKTLQIGLVGDSSCCGHARGQRNTPVRFDPITKVYEW